MRSFICAMMLAMLPATMAAGQLFKKDDKPVGGRPAQAKGDVDAGLKAKDAEDAPQGNAIFEVIDVDGDGVINKLELRKAIKQLLTLDADKDGSITLAEVSAGGGPIGPGGAAANDPQIARIMAHDKNRDGKLTLDEVPDEMLPMLQNADQNNDGAIDRQELTGAMANVRNQFRGGPGGPWAGGGGGDAEQVTGQFLQYDRNGDGRLTPNELPQQATRMLRGGDQNNDGAIDAAELQAVLARMGGRAKAAGAELGGPGNTFRDPNRRGGLRAGDQK